MITPRALSRRRAVLRLGAGGFALGVAASTRAALAQESTPVLPRAVPSELEGWAAGWEAQDPAQIAAAYAEDATVEVVPFGTLLEGAAAIEEYFTAYFGAFTDATATISTVFATANQGGAEWVFEGQYTGQLPGLPAGQGQGVAVRGANIMALEDGRIVRESIYTDLAGLLVQIGAIEPSVPGVATPAAPAG